jgi:hypothetical protein
MAERVTKSQKWLMKSKKMTESLKENGQELKNG